MESLVCLHLVTCIIFVREDEVIKMYELGNIFQLDDGCFLFLSDVKIEKESRKFSLLTALTFPRKRELFQAVFQQPKCIGCTAGSLGTDHKPHS